MLAAELRDPVGRDRARTGVLRRGVRLRLAVHRRRRREYDTHACPCARLEHALRGQQVLPDVDREHVAEAPHARLRGQVEDAVDAAEIERLVREVEPPHVQPARVLLFLGRVIGIREAVDAEQVVTRLDERVRELRADEPGCTGDDVSHRGTIP